MFFTLSSVIFVIFISIKPLLLLSLMYPDRSIPQPGWGSYVVPDSGTKRFFSFADTPCIRDTASQMHAKDPDYFCIAFKNSNSSVVLSECLQYRS